jgi:alkylated DNA repair protein (DNA oxidative demethylase)
MTMNLFDSLADVELQQEQFGPGATVLRQFAVTEETALLSALEDVIARAPFRHMVAPGGFLSNSRQIDAWRRGRLGWPGQTALPRCVAAQGRPSPSGGRPSHL